MLPEEGFDGGQMQLMIPHKTGWFLAPVHLPAADGTLQGHVPAVACLLALSMAFASSFARLQ